MAEHGAVEHATAATDDYAEHRATYDEFVHLVVVAITYLASLLIGLAIVGVIGNLYVGAPLIFIATLVASAGVFSRSTAPGYVMVVVSLLALAFTATQ
jgi:Bacterial aa3 type cytochrome c oxidase subunit IV